MFLLGFGFVGFGRFVDDDDIGVFCRGCGCSRFRFRRFFFNRFLRLWGRCFFLRHRCGSCRQRFGGRRLFRFWCRNGFPVDFRDLRCGARGDIGVGKDFFDAAVDGEHLFGIGEVCQNRTIVFSGVFDIKIKMLLLHPL